VIFDRSDEAAIEDGPRRSSDPAKLALRNLRNWVRFAI
jgi:hypothetical protein